MSKLRLCLVASEVAPFAKTGGLADVVAGLARFLDHDGHDVRVVLPLYRSVRSEFRDLRPLAPAQNVEVRSPSGAVQRFGALTTKLPGSGADVVFLDCPALYDRDGIYRSDGDDHLRFGLLSRGALEVCQRLQWSPDIVHCNDWHTALVPIYLRTSYAWDGLFASTKTLLTIHNIGFQGVFGPDVLDDLGLRDQQQLLHQDDLRDGRVNFLKTGILYANWINTVSRTYAQEILTPEFGSGVEGELNRRRDSLSGIVNGVDYGEWDPAHDPHIAATYDRANLAGKTACRRALLARLGLPDDPHAAVLGVVSRLTWQKGFELLPDVLPTLLDGENIRFVLLGSGEDGYERYFQRLRDQFPRQVGFYRGFHNELAHQIEAGADMFLMPSRYEPCGLNQMYSLRYGTVPIVRRTGGLADTVQQYEEGRPDGTGFTFGAFAPGALLDTVRYALRTWRNKSAWAELMHNGMAKDFSWQRQGHEYLALYRMLRG
ncbi:MAG: glycogen synthase GlgA [Planctomycetota bacterium]